jgi:hypothetical protein
MGNTPQYYKPVFKKKEKERKRKQLAALNISMPYIDVNEFILASL